MNDGDRMQAIKESGCIATMLATRRYSQPCDVHHLTDANKRLGHQHTIGLSPWNHRGVKLDGMSRQDMMGIFGPSLADGRRTFEAFFGSQQLLLRIQNAILDHYARSPWFDYEIPWEVRRLALMYWEENK